MYQKHDFVGAYPYAAVGDDCSKTYDLLAGQRTLYFKFAYYLCLPSLPCDLVFDTVLLPADLIAWPCECEKVYD